MGRRQQCLIRFKKLMVEGNDNGCEESLFRTSMRGMEKFEKHVIYWLKTLSMFSDTNPMSYARICYNRKDRVKYILGD